MTALREIMAANPKVGLNDIKMDKVNDAIKDSLPKWFNKGYFDSVKYTVQGTKLLKNGTSVVHLSFLEPDSIEPFEKMTGDFLLLVRGDTGTYFANGTAYYLNLHNISNLNLRVLDDFTDNLVYSPTIGISPYSAGLTNRGGRVEFGFGVHLATLKTPISKPTQ